MKRRFILLLSFALALALAACGKPTEAPPDVPADPPAPAGEEPLVLDALNVEFSVGGRDDDTLLTLRQAFPTALVNALAAQDVTVGTVYVTFGVSTEATETAIQSGAVQLAFLPAEDYALYREGKVVAAERAEEPGPTRGLLISGVAEERFTDALRVALPQLAEVLAPYAAEDAAGVYEWNEDVAALYGEP